MVRASAISVLLASCSFTGASPSDPSPDGGSPDGSQTIDAATDGAGDAAVELACGAPSLTTLVACWEFEGNLAEEVGGVPPASESGTVGYVAGPSGLGQALDLNGTNTLALEAAPTTAPTT